MVHVSHSRIKSHLYSTITKSNLANLILMPKADGVMHPMKSLFVQGLANQMKIDNVAFSRIAKSLELASKMVASDEETRVRHFCELIVLSQADFSSSKEEK